jgi:hypothetical protein
MQSGIGIAFFLLAHKYFPRADEFFAALSFFLFFSHDILNKVGFNSDSFYIKRKEKGARTVGSTDKQFFIP